MALLKKWRDMAYSETANKGDLQRLWSDYFEKEKEIYAELLKSPDEVVSGTVKELAEKYGIDIMTMTGFLDGINDSLKGPNRLTRWKKTHRLLWDLIKSSYIKIWWRPVPTGCMNCPNGKPFLTRIQGRLFTGSRNLLQPS